MCTEEKKIYIYIDESFPCRCCRSRSALDALRVSEASVTTAQDQNFLATPLPLERTWQVRGECAGLIGVKEKTRTWGPGQTLLLGHSGDAEAAATAAVYDDDPAVAQSQPKKQGKRKKRKGAKSSAPQAMSQERPSSPSRPAAAPQPVGPVGNVRHRKNNCLDCLQQAGSSGVGSCEGAFRFRGLAGGPILDCDGTGMACASSSGIAGAETSPVLQEEIYQFVGAVMHPESHVQWGELVQWQRNLQVQARGQQLLNPFWHAVLFDLDIELHLCVEVFTKVLVEEKLPLDLLAGWQKSLQGQTHKLWYPRRLWPRAHPQPRLDCRYCSSAAPSHRTAGI